MNSSMERIEGNKAFITIEIRDNDFEASLQSAYLRNRNSMNVPGFRKGKAPRRVIENYFGEGVFYQDAFEELYPDAYDEAISEHDIHPIELPTIDIVDIGKSGVKFTATVELLPIAEISEYKGITFSKIIYPVTDGDIDAEMSRLQERQARYIDVDREAELQDRVNINFSGSIDGVKFEGGTAENQFLTLGSQMFIPGFEEQLVGMKKGETRIITVTFPEEYSNEELSGKEAQFEVVLNEVTYKELPELDDEFIKDISEEYDTLEAYRAFVAGNLAEANEKQSRTSLEADILNKLAERTTVEVPEVLIERELDNIIRRQEYNMMYLGIQFEQYLQMVGATLESFREEHREEAITNLKGQIALITIRELESITAVPEQIDEAVTELLKPYGEMMTMEEYLQYNSVSESNLRSDAKNTVLHNNTIDFLIANNTVEETLSPIEEHDHDHEGHDHDHAGHDHSYEGHDHSHEGHDHEGHDHEHHDHE